MGKMLRVGIVANEVSGDHLAASLMRALRAKYPDIQFEGMTGPAMVAEGCKSLAVIDPVMGLAEVLKHLPSLISTRKQLFRHFADNPPDVFIGVDAPDFNLQLETRLKQAGIKTVHFVSPTVWAWRQKRVTKVRKAVDLMLSIFPFEVDFLRQHDVPVAYVGHPLADEIPIVNDSVSARERLDIPLDAPVIAILPGSRASELKGLGETFIKTAQWCLEKEPSLRFVTPLVNSGIRQLFESELQRLAPGLPIHMVEGNSRDAILSADLVLTASGTATLETLLLKRPMVVGYRLHWLTYWLVKTFDLLKIPHFAMANLLSPEPLAPEFLQDECQPELLGKALMELLGDKPRRERIGAIYHDVHAKMRLDAAATAADAVLELIQTAKP
ncbi:MAG: lipid-A-disaccharide synthase [Candidatus Sedimenticola sp. 1PA]